jgi:hypothetical protein
MATVDKTEMTEAELFQCYLELRLQKGDRKVPIDQLLSDFPKYLQQLSVMRAKVQEAVEASGAGRSGPLNWDAFEARLRHRLAEAGIRD